MCICRSRIPFYDYSLLYIIFAIDKEQFNDKKG